jgi:hypothetical protein
VIGFNIHRMLKGAFTLCASFQSGLKGWGLLLPILSGTSLAKLPDGMTLSTSPILIK